MVWDKRFFRCALEAMGLSAAFWLFLIVMFMW